MNAQELAQRRSEDQFRLLVETVQDYAIFMLDPAGNIASWNAGAERIKGYKADEIIGKHFSIFYTAEDLQQSKPARELEIAAATGRYEEEGWRVRKDGSILWANVVITAMRDQSGALVGFAKVTRDLSERKRVEDELRASHLLVETVQDYAIFMLDLAGNIASWNAGAERIKGYKSEEVIGKHFSIFYTAEDLQQSKPARELEIATATGRYEEEGWRVRKDGSTFWANVVITAVRDRAGVLTGFAKITRDLTERKQAEEVRRLREFRHLLEALPAGAYTCDVEGLITFFNRSAVQIWGRIPKLNDASDRYCGSFRLCSPDGSYVDRDQCWMARTLRERKEYRGREIIVERQDGSRLPVLAYTEPLFDPDGQLIGAVNILVDITARKRSETLLAAVFDNVINGIIGIDDRSVIQSFNQVAEKQLGYKKIEVVGQTLKLLMPELYPNESDSDVDSGVRAGIGKQTSVRRKDGSIFPAELKISEFFLDGQRHYTVVVRDLTEQRRIEESQRTSSLRLQMALNAGRMGTWAWDIPTNMCHWNEREYELLGLMPNDGPIDSSVFFERVLPEDLPHLQRSLTEVQEFGKEYRAEFRIARADGEIRWLAGFGGINRDKETGKPTEMYGVNFDITERKRTEEALQLRDRAMRAVSQGILITDPHQLDNPIIYASPGFEQLTGYRSEEVIGRNCRFLQGPNTDAAVVKQLREAIRAGQECSVEILNYRKDMTPFWNALFVTPVRDERGKLLHFVGVQVDITQRRNLEEQVRQSQKMEAVGQLAGGVAHDFNNLLTIISGYSEILLELLPPNDPKRSTVQAISDAGERAAGLTRQLLAFSRQTVLEPRVLDLNSVVHETDRMLHRMIGEDVLLTAKLDPNLNLVKVDRGQMGQVLMNLAVNARDAMPQGGRLTIETRNIELDEAYVNTHIEVPQGHYVLVTVSDTGTGMPPEVRARIFEPFFTTKGVGKGTGLGLSVVHGIVKQSNGLIGVYSEVGIGTTFKIYLPVVEKDQAFGSAEIRRTMKIKRGSETILLVEDETGVREIALLALQTHGYKVFSAASGKEALKIVKEHAIDMLVTDVVMPEMSGRQLAEILQPMYPQMKILYLSGYTDDAVVRHGILQAEVAFLEKPYTPTVLLRKVRDVLDS